MNEIVQKIGLHYLFYDGNWEDQKRNGYGKQLFPNGAYYEGNWLSNKAEGFGRMIFVSGLTFEGDFRRNIMIKGTYLFNLKFCIIFLNLKEK